jgi:hypothetical protein
MHVKLQRVVDCFSGSLSSLRWIDVIQSRFFFFWWSAPAKVFFVVATGCKFLWRCSDKTR